MIPTAYATTSTSSIALFQQMATTTGQFIEDSVQFLYFGIGLFLALFAIMIILGAFKKALGKGRLM